MNDRNLDHLLDAWLDLGPEAAPDRVGAAARREVRSTPQGAAWLGWLQRFPIMNSTTMRYGIAAVVVVIAALVGFSYFSPDVADPGPSIVDPPLPSVSSVPSDPSVAPVTSLPPVSA